MLLAHWISPPLSHAQGTRATPNEGFYHKGTRTNCDQSELDRLRKDVTELQKEARDVQADKHMAELKLDTVRNQRIYVWNGSIVRLLNAIVKIGAEYSTAGWGKVAGVASDVFQSAQVSSGGYEIGPSTENALNWLGQFVKVCSLIESCWRSNTFVNGQTYGQAVSQLADEQLGSGANVTAEQYSEYAQDVRELDQTYSEAAEANAENGNKAMAWVFLAVNAGEFANDLDEDWELSDEIERLQQRWNTIDGQIDSDLKRIAPLVAVCGGGKSTSSVPRRFAPPLYEQPRVAVASIAPELALLELLRRAEFNERQSPANIPDTGRAFPYRAMHDDLQRMIANITDGRTRISTKVMPVLSLFIGNSPWRRLDRGVLLTALQSARPDLAAADQDFRQALEVGQRVIRQMGNGADLGAIQRGRVAVTPVALNGAVSFVDANASAHVMRLLTIGAGGRQAQLEVQSTPQVLQLAVGDSASVTLDRWSVRRVRVTLQAVYPFGAVLVALHALPPHVLVDLDATTLEVLALVVAVVAGGFFFGSRRRVSRRELSSPTPQRR